MRKGKCQPEICGAACCKVFQNIAGEEGLIEGKKFSFSKGICDKLKDNKCLIYKDRPKACKDFPDSPDNPAYQAVKDKCTYYFE